MLNWIPDIHGQLEAEFKLALDDILSQASDAPITKALANDGYRTTGDLILCVSDYMVDELCYDDAGIMKPLNAEDKGKLKLLSSSYDKLQAH